MRLRPTLALVAFAAAAPLAAKPAPIAGTWAVDVSQLAMPPEARPKSVTFVFTPQPHDRWTLVVDIVAPDDSVRHMSSTFAADGKAAPIIGDTAEADMGAARMPAPNVLVMALGKGGIPASTRIYTVAPSGRAMVETAVYFGEDGKPIMRTNHFNRVR